MIKIVYRLCIQYAIEMYNKYEMLPVHFELFVYQSCVTVDSKYFEYNEKRNVMKLVDPKYI